MDYQEIYYPETKFGGFTKIDGTIAFYIRVVSLLDSDDAVLDFGCGRGEYQEDPVQLRRDLRVFKGKVRKVIGIDVDEKAESNPYIDEFHLLKNERWPLQDNSVDLCLCDWVLEHLKEPENFFSEAKRVIKQGGYLCIRTSNKWGYAGILSAVIPNRFHADVLDRVQKDRAKEDVFPIYNKCNTPYKIRSMLNSYKFNHVVYTHEAEPAYLHFSQFVYFLGVIFQKLSPSPFRRSIFAFAENQ